MRNTNHTENKQWSTQHNTTQNTKHWATQTTLKTNNDLQNTTQNTKHWATQTTLKTNNDLQNTKHWATQTPLKANNDLPKNNRCYEIYVYLSNISIRSFVLLAYPLLFLNLCIFCKKSCYVIIMLLFFSVPLYLAVWE